MNEKELFDLLRTIQIDDTHTIPVAYDHFEENLVNRIVPPFILYRNTDTTTLKADDKVFYQNNNYIIDLVYEVKNIALEQKLEKLLNDNYLPYDKEEDYLFDERIYQIRYFI